MRHSLSLVLALGLTFECASTSLAQPGSLDLSFDAGSGVDARVESIALQPDGKIVIGGVFSTVRGLGRSRIARLNPDGSGDSTFDPGAGADGEVASVMVQPDGKILAAGRLANFEGASAYGIARLNDDGSRDISFNAGTGADANIYCMALQSDGGILIGGYFTHVNGATHNHIARLYGNGGLDDSFHGDTSGSVYSIAVQQDGKVLIGGDFAMVSGTTNHASIARLNADGSLDGGFNASVGPSVYIYAIAVQPNGEVLIAGYLPPSYWRSQILRLNSDGSLDPGFHGETNDLVRSMLLQPDGKILIGGAFTQIDGRSRNGLARLNSDGSLDATFDPGTGAYDNSYPSFVYCVALDSGGKVVAGGDFTRFNDIVRNHITRVNSNGSLDADFNPGSGISGPVNSVVVRDDGKVLIGGTFRTVSDANRSMIARLNSDGGLDTSFDPGTGIDLTYYYFALYSLAVLPGGKAMIAGWFDHYNGAPLNMLGRLNPNGSRDTSFDPGAGFSGRVFSIALQADGKLIAGGGFGSFDGTPRACLARLNGDGTLDADFDPASGADQGIYAVAVQPDGKVLIGGNFTVYHGGPARRIARVNTNGTLDTTFNANKGASNTVYSVILQPDGKVLIGGAFTTVNATNRNGIARLNSNGGLDTSFDPGTGVDGTVYSIALQADGKLLVGGAFTTFNGAARSGVARVNADGTLDNTFQTGSGVNGSVFSIAQQPDGQVLIAGDFTLFNGFARWRAARLNGDRPRLSLLLSGTANITISWPSYANAFTLQEAPDPGGAWTNVLATPADNGTNLTLSFPISPGDRFYRLKR